MEEKKKFVRAITISENNIAIERDDSKCIDCGLCKKNCELRQGIIDLCDGKACVNCGQCVQICPTGAIVPKQDSDKLRKALADGKVCIAYTSPSVRVAIGDEFGMERGEFVQGKLVSALKKIGFKYVLDVTFGADLTIVEEANELVQRIKENKNLPMFTSCCPAWVKYAEQYYPELLNNLSTCKSPISMEASIIRNFFVDKNNLDKDNIFTVAITPCTAKKYEVSREELLGTDIVLTTSELSKLLKEKNIDFANLEDKKYDSLLGEGSGAGMIFGNTGGVTEAAIRTANYVLTGEDLDRSKIVLKQVRGIDNVREATIKIGENEVKVAVIHQISSAKKILEDAKNGKSKYDFIEVMNCLGGCIGGGGQPKYPIGKEKEIKEKRKEALYNKDAKDVVRSSHRNPDVKRIYRELLEKPLSEKAHELLHTTYTDKSNFIK